ncbi:hypothetical protein ARAM_007290 [Aspergillus rambellii]|uniref:Integral membrane protein n=1 Tax=Aspergillus rambellii TaxID=308745 RepID=A0A0F8V478_9EURO|nr:hypothetical protein ARAM_007290 [Aspergillus rambellii]
MDTTASEITVSLEMGSADRLPKHSSHSPFSSNLDSMTFIRHRRRWIPSRQCMLRNSLLAGVGYLELANAGDFAANVWNETPVPVYATVLMAIGGTAALAMSVVTVKDAHLSWENIRLLREERHFLRSHRVTESEKDDAVDVDIDSHLDVNSRELGTELVDRIVMDVFLGIGAVLVGIGALLAIGGANHQVWLASNLLSGYLGNSPAALYGLLNAVWSTCLWARADHHGLAGAKELDREIVRGHLQPRLRSIKLHACTNGISGLVAGVASMITATHWWGYVLLLPCIICSIWCNYYWRHAVGYERPCCRLHLTSLSKDSLLQALQTFSFARQALETPPTTTRASPSSETTMQPPLGDLIEDPGSLQSVLDFIIANDLFEHLCVDLLQREQLAADLFNVSDTGAVTITSSQLLEADTYTSQILEIARQCILRVGRKHFLYRERFLIELLGCYLARANAPRRSAAV